MNGAPKYDADFSHLSYVNPDAPKGGTLIQSAAGTFDSLNPYAIKGTAAQGLQLFYDRLMTRVWDEPFTLYPLIADKVTVAEDRSAIAFHIDPRARFHDGSPITGDDVVFSFETLRTYGRPNMRRVYGLVASVERPDAATVIFRLGPGYDRETVMILGMMPVLSKTYWRGRTFDSSTLDIPQSNGPYRIKSVDPGRRIVYERVKNYWAADLPVNRGQFNFDRIIYDYYRDDTVALEAFKAGNVDLRREVDAGKWATGYNIPAVARGDIVKEEIVHKRPERVSALIFNTRRAPFDDVRVRQALSHMLDSQWINQNLFHGRYKRVTSYFPNSELAAQGRPSPGEMQYLEPWRASLAPEIFGPAWQPPDSAGRDNLRAHMRIADKLLREAGWVVRDGMRVRADAPSRVFAFEIIVSTAEDQKIAMQFARGLTRMGIRATIRMLDSAAFIGRRDAYDYDMMVNYWQNSLSPGTEQRLYWSCAAAKEKARFNYAGICNPAVDALSASIAAAPDRQAMVDNARALDRALTWGWYIIPLYYAGTDNVAHVRRVTHAETIPVYGAVFESWWDGSASGANKH